MENHPLSLALLGSTGSIGRQALSVAQAAKIKITALCAKENVSLMESQCRQYKPKIAALYDEKAASILKIKLADTPVKVLAGEEGIRVCAAETEADMVLNALVGVAGLLPTLDAIDAGKHIALANKETLVAGGKLVMERAKSRGVRIMPVDSEHSAIFQSLLSSHHNKDEISRIILTASGGPFFGKNKSQLKNVTKEEALLHPNWSMGKKITIDSATLINKGLELIEAVWLFDVLPSMVDIVVHRQSVVHSMAEFIDGSVIAQIGAPDMCLPIQYALTYPKRLPCPARRLDILSCGSLTFDPPDYDAFPGPVLCRKAIEKGGAAPAAVNGANEEAVHLFLMDKIPFYRITELCGRALDEVKDIPDPSISDILEADKAARELVRGNC